MTKLVQIITILGNARTAGGMSDEDVALQIMRDCGFEEDVDMSMRAQMLARAQSNTVPRSEAESISERPARTDKSK